MSALQRIRLPSPPTVTAVQLSQTSARVTWAAVPGATSFKLWRNATLIGSASSPYDDTGLGNGTYSYTVAAVGSKGEGPPSSAAIVALGDVTPPTAPGTPSVAALSSSSLSISWTAATDAGGSGLAGYRLERSVNGSTGWTQITDLPGLSATDNGLAASTAYYYRIRAYDVAGNVGDYSTIGTGTTQAASAAVVWNSSPDQTMYVGVPYSQDLDAYCTGSVYYAVISGTLPAGLTLDATTGVISGTPSAASSGAVTIRAFDNLAEGDFYGRSHAPGVTFVDGFESAADFANKYIPGPTGVRAALDSTIRKGAGSSLRFDIKAGEATARISGAYVLGTLGGSGFGQNTTFYVQHRLRLSANWETNYMNYWRNTATGMKVFIIHQGSSTNSDLEITFASYVTTQMAMNSGSVLFWTNLNDPFFVDGRYTYDRLDQSGWNLDAGGPPWSVEANSFHNGSQHFWDDEWITFYLKVHIGTLNGTHSLGGAPLDSTLEAWVKRESEGFYRKFCACKFGQPYTGATSDAFNNMTLTPYMTGLATPAPTDSSMWLDELIISSQPIAMPLT